MCKALTLRPADIVNYLSNRLATQKKNDFTPKNDDLAFSRMNTEPCIACSEALEKVEQVARSSLSVGRASGTVSSTSGMSRSLTLSRPGSGGTMDEDGDEGRASSSRNTETFLTEIGVAFHGLLLEHLRKFTVSPAGGLMLTK